MYEVGGKEMEGDLVDWKWKVGVRGEGGMMGVGMDRGGRGL